MTHLPPTPWSTAVHADSSQRKEKEGWALTFHTVCSQMDNLIVQRVGICGLGKRKEKGKKKKSCCILNVLRRFMACQTRVWFVMNSRHTVSFPGRCVHMCACMRTRSCRAQHTHTQRQSSLLSSEFLPCGDSVRHLNLHHAVRRNKHIKEQALK